MPEPPNPFQGWDLPQAEYDRALAAFGSSLPEYRKTMRRMLRFVVLQRERARAVAGIEPLDPGDDSSTG